MLLRALSALLALALVPALLTAPDGGDAQATEASAVALEVADDAAPRPVRDRADRARADRSARGAEPAGDPAAVDLAAAEEDALDLTAAAEEAEAERAAEEEAAQEAARAEAREATMAQLDTERREAAEERRRKEEEERRAREEAERRAREEAERQRQAEQERQRAAEARRREESAPAAAPAAAAPAPASAPAAPSGGVWDRLAQCESGGNWHINTGNGYYGGLQFSASTWRAVGGTGLPHEHSRAEQIHRGQLLQSRAGWGQWPACSRKLGLR